MVHSKDKIEEQMKDLVDNFPSYISIFKTNNPFSGPSEYFYIHKIISITKKGNYELVFTKEFIEYIYATLASWGMHRMGPENKGAKMNDFDSFQNCILSNKETILKLKDCRLEKVNIEEIKSELEELYLGFWSLMKSNSKLVASSKVMHFLLPHLIPPMDREYTMKFFGKNLPSISSFEDKNNIAKELKIFLSTLLEMMNISHQVDCSKFIDDNFSPTIPKVIDNAIVSYIRKNKQ